MTVGSMPRNRPNILLMISHDLGCHIGSYGWATDQSPNLNRFAQQSLQFDRHFVTSPGCSQSRSSLVTGRYPHANGQFGLAHLGWSLNRDEILLPAVLRQADYQTALFGIWHLHDWTLAGFESVSDDVSTRDASPEGFAEVASVRAAEWLRQRKPDDRPFYLHVGFWETHRPFCANEQQVLAAGQISLAAEQVPPYLPDTPPVRSELAGLHQSVRLVDQGVGRILESLATSGLDDETIVLFTADHGLPFPRAKGTLYDPGIQVALLIRPPGGRPYRRIGALTSNADIMPTLLDQAQIPVPEAIQGVSFTRLLADKPVTRADRDAVFAEKTYHEHYDPIRCVRNERFKYIRNFAQRPKLVMPSDIYNSPTRKSITDDESIWSARAGEELYDLTVDPAERDNCLADPNFSEARDQLRRRLDQWMHDTDDPLLKGPILRPFPAAN